MDGLRSTFFPDFDPMKKRLPVPEPTWRSVCKERNRGRIGKISGCRRAFLNLMNRRCLSRRKRQTVLLLQTDVLHREYSLNEFMEQGSCGWSRSEGKCTIQRVGKRLDSLTCERLEFERKNCPTDQSSRTEGDFNSIDG